MPLIRNGNICFPINSHLYGAKANNTLPSKATPKIKHPPAPAWIKCHRKAGGELSPGTWELLSPACTPGGVCAGIAQPWVSSPQAGRQVPAALLGVTSDQAQGTSRVLRESRGAGLRLELQRSHRRRWADGSPSELQKACVLGQSQPSGGPGGSTLHQHRPVDGTSKLLRVHSPHMSPKDPLQDGKPSTGLTASHRLPSSK